MKHIALAAIAVLTLAGCTSTQPEPSIDRVTIEGLVAVADGDHAASTYVDGVLVDPAAGHRDRLLTVNVIDGEVHTADVDVPNSVTAAPEVLALTPDGRTAFVAERLGQRRPGDTRADQLEPGTRLTAVDVSDADHPTVVAAAVIAESPESISVSPDGRHVAVAANTPSAAVLEVLPWRMGEFGQSRRFDVAELGVTGDAPGPRAGVLVTNVQWHPEGRALAVNVDSQDRVAFLRVDDGAGGIALSPWGVPVDTGPDPFVGRFTPDGRHYVTANWGRDLTTTVAAERLPKSRSTLSVISLDDQPRAVATAESDKSTEGLAISPDGALVATVNMRGTVFPEDSPLFDREASVSLFRLDPVSGGLTKTGDYPLTAVLPEGGTFDTSGRYFIATSFQGRGTDEGGPGLQVYRVDSDAGLVAAQRITLPHGVHHVAAG